MAVAEDGLTGTKQKREKRALARRRPRHVEPALCLGLDSEVFAGGHCVLHRWGEKRRVWRPGASIPESGPTLQGGGEVLMLPSGGGPVQRKRSVQHKKSGWREGEGHNKGQDRHATLVAAAVGGTINPQGARPPLALGAPLIEPTGPRCSQAFTEGELGTRIRRLTSRSQKRCGNASAATGDGRKNDVPIRPADKSNWAANQPLSP